MNVHTSPVRAKCLTPMTAPEAYITFRPGLITDEGEVTDESTAELLAGFMRESASHTERVLRVPRLVAP